MQHWIVDEEIDTIQKEVIEFIKKRNFKIFSIIDQKQEAEDVGLKIPETRLLIFGNPKVGTLLMQENDDITFELPSKLLLIEKENSQTELIYRDPFDFAGSEQLSERGRKIIQNMHTMYDEMMKSL